MPRISEFLGIVITMYFRDHNPPHFHAQYAEYEAAVAVVEPRILKGRLPPRVLALVEEWAVLHEEELLENWERARHRRPLNRISPLI